MAEREIQAGQVRLAADDAGEGAPVILLHGLSATRRYVVMGSRALERGGYRVVAYDARGHGRSAAAPDPGAYGYDALCADLEAVLDSCGVERAVLAGSSMGAHTLLRFCLEHPGRVAALCVITPAHDPQTWQSSARLARWDALADGLRGGGIEGFVSAYDAPSRVPERWVEITERVLRQRMAEHDDLEAVADALQTVPRYAPFEALSDLEDIRAPCVVVGDRDEADPGHPLAIAEAYAEAIPGAELLVEEPGSSPLAWQGGRISRVIADLAAASR